VVGDYVGIVTNVVLATLGLLLLRRYFRCWRADRQRDATA
jgi:hypothetical protein